MRMREALSDDFCALQTLAASLQGCNAAARK
jgi:hypothetical protein